MNSSKLHTSSSELRTMLYGSSDIFQRSAGNRSSQALSLGTRTSLLHSARWSFLCIGLAACEHAPAEPSPPSVDAVALTSDPKPSEPPVAVSPQPSPISSTACLQPMADEAPPQVTSLTECPVDTDGRPEMPKGIVRFSEAQQAPELKVELALHLDDQRHGLMFRPQLKDDEGMLFSYRDQRPRHFWMHNTCLALDMIHIDRDDRIVGIVENVPPWNDTTRSIRCAAMHVLEVPAGWARRYGVKPGQLVQITGQILAK